MTRQANPTRPTRQGAQRPTRTALAALAASELAPVIGTDALSVDAAHACAPRYNEVIVGAQRTGPNEVLVMLHACRGVETSRGLRTVTLSRVMLSATDAAWKYCGESFQALRTELESRRGLPSVERMFA